MKNKIFLLVMIFSLLIMFPANVYAEHVLGIEAFAQYLDISQLEAEKFVFEFDETSYEIYYGYHGSMDDSMTDSLGDPVVKEMIINQENKSIEVIFDEVPEKTDFWVRIPFEVLTAEKEKYQVLIDGVNTGYDIMKMPDGYVVGMIISADTKYVEIIGTQVIPEFGAYATLILAISIMSLALFTKKFSFVGRF